MEENGTVEGGAIDGAMDVTGSTRRSSARRWWLRGGACALMIGALSSEMEEAPVPDGVRVSNLKPPL
ncbi:hypothetical protein U1Q18_039283, partial [Sarracenia purpurea var. burkii]